MMWIQFEHSEAAKVFRIAFMVSMKNSLWRIQKMNKYDWRLLRILKTEYDKQYGYYEPSYTSLQIHLTSMYKNNE